MAFDVGGRGDQSFNDLAALAWDEGKRMYGYTGRELAPDAGGENREENLRLLAETGSSRAVAPIRPLLNDPLPDNRAAAAEALGKFGDRASIPRLRERSRSTASRSGRTTR